MRDRSWSSFQNSQSPTVTQAKQKGAAARVLGNATLGWSPEELQARTREARNRFVQSRDRLRPRLSLLRSPNHVRHGAAGRDKRQHMLGVRRDDVQDVRSLGLEHPLQSRFEIALKHHALAGDIETFANA